MMSCLFSFLILLALVLGALLVAAHAQARSQLWNEAYRALAERFSGQFVAGGWFDRPSVRFSHGATYVLVKPQATSQWGPLTQIQMHWPDHALRLEVFPRSGRPAPKPLRGMLPVSTGRSDFDGKFVVRSNVPDRACQLLGDGARWQIEQLHTMPVRGELYISLLRGRLVIRKWGAMLRQQRLVRLTELAVALYDQLQLVRSEGIEFLETGQVQLIDEAVCQICGDAIRADMVFCRRCKTPHHKECWHYYGSCSVYGCQESAYVVPRVARPVELPSRDRR